MELAQSENGQKSFIAAVADRLKTARDLKGLSPEQVAERAGNRVSASYIRRLERAENSPTVEMLWILCGAYETTLAKFFASLEPPEEPKRKRA